MKTKYLFLLKLLGYSLLFYLVGQKLLYSYASSMTDSLNVQDPRYHLPPDLDKMLYGYSTTIIAFLSLTLATPMIPRMKKASFIGIGMVAFVVTDFFFIQYIKGDSSLTADSFVYELYLCFKWLLPFLLWIAMSSPYIGKLLEGTNKISGVSTGDQTPAK